MLMGCHAGLSHQAFILCTLCRDHIKTVHEFRVIAVEGKSPFRYNVILKINTVEQTASFPGAGCFVWLRDIHQKVGKFQTICGIIC